MARQGKGILDGPHGSLSNVTGYRSKEKSIIKTKNTISTKPKTPAQLQSQDDFRFAMRVYKRFRNSMWWPYLNYNLKGKSMMNQILSFNQLFRLKETKGIEDVNIFGRADFKQNVLLEPVWSVNPNCYRINNYNAPLTPEALPNDRYFFLVYSHDTDTLGIQGNTSQLRGLTSVVSQNICEFPSKPGTSWGIFLWFRFDYSAISSQSMIIRYFP